MKVKIKHVGCSPANNYHEYWILCENGHVDRIYEPTYNNATEIDMPDEIWTEGSGWADIKCNVCGTQYRERCRPGMVVACPCCSEPELIPDDACLEKSNLAEDDE